MQVEPPLRERQLHQLGVQLGEVELRVVGQIDRDRADPELGAGLRIGGEPGAGRNRQIDPRRRPIAVARAEEGERPRDDADAADARRRFLLRESRRNEGEAQQQEDGSGEEAHGSTLKIVLPTTAGL